MSWKIAGAGVAGAAALGLFAGGLLQPTLAGRSEAPLDPVAATASGPADLTPPYVSPQSLQAWRTADSVSFAPDPIERQVSRDLARASAELRASEAALQDYHRAAVLVRSAAEVADRLGAFSDDSAERPASEEANVRPPPAPPLPAADAQLTRY